MDPLGGGRLASSFAEACGGPDRDSNDGEHRRGVSPNGAAAIPQYADFTGNPVQNRRKPSHSCETAATSAELLHQRRGWTGSSGVYRTTASGYLPTRACQRILTRRGGELDVTTMTPSPPYPVSFPTTARAGSSGSSTTSHTPASMSANLTRSRAGTTNAVTASHRRRLKPNIQPTSDNFFSDLSNRFNALADNSWNHVRGFRDPGAISLSFAGRRVQMRARPVSAGGIK